MMFQQYSQVLGVILLCGTAVCQEPAPVGLVRGNISLLMIRGPLGSLDLKTPAGDVVQCDFDSQTLFERDGLKIASSEIKDNQSVEVLTDRKRGRCYARIIRMVASDGAATRLRPPKLRYNPVEHIYPRGNLTFSGFVVRTSAGSVVLRTRTEPEKTFLLRHDTRFLESGFPAELSQLTINTRVFVRSSKTPHNELEAHQIVWGEIEGPKPRESF